MATEQQVCVAIVAILGAAAGVRSAAGRTSDLVVDRDQLGPSIALPALGYRLESYSEETGKAELHLTAGATGATANADAHALLEAAKSALDATAFKAQGLDVMVFYGAKRSADDEPEGQLDLQQADWSLPLLVVD